MDSPPDYLVIECMGTYDGGPLSSEQIGEGVGYFDSNSLTLPRRRASAFVRTETAILLPPGDRTSRRFWQNAKLYLTSAFANAEDAPAEQMILGPQILDERGFARMAIQGPLLDGIVTQVRRVGNGETRTVQEHYRNSGRPQYWPDQFRLLVALQQRGELAKTEAKHVVIATGTPTYLEEVDPTVGVGDEVTSTIGDWERTSRVEQEPGLRLEQSMVPDRVAAAS